MLEINCNGTPYEIGQWHGRLAADAVKRSIAFYRDLFKKDSGLSWDEACSIAVKFMPMLERRWQDYVDEMKGVASGAEVDFVSILALNVRTEIAFGMAIDGCTALSWLAQHESFLAQNWDWQAEQKKNLVALRIVQHERPTIHMITEAGIIGKIGLNSEGVGVTLNAIRAKGIDFERLPCHLALRTALDSTSRHAAVSTLKEIGVASACHILVADTSGGVGMEFSAHDIVQLPMDDAGIVTHTNHYIEPHVLESVMFLPDSTFRLRRIRELMQNAGSNPSLKKIETMLNDEKNFPGSICRGASKQSTSETVFSIVMDLKKKSAHVRIGRPVAAEGDLMLGP